MMMCFNALFKALFWGTEGGFAFRAPNITITRKAQIRANMGLTPLTEGELDHAR